MRIEAGRDSVVPPAQTTVDGPGYADVGAVDPAVAEVGFAGATLRVEHPPRSVRPSDDGRIGRRQVDRIGVQRRRSERHDFTLPASRPLTMWRWVRTKKTTMGIRTITLIVMNPGQSVENSPTDR
jgi:hypothetical protein